MIASILLTIADYSFLFGLVGGGLMGSIVTVIVTLYRSRIQKMKCYYLDDEVITKIPVETAQGKHENIYTKQFKLKNTTNKDIPTFRIIFEFGAQTQLLKKDTRCKMGNNQHKVKVLKGSECSFTIKDFNRGDEVYFNFEIANINIDNDLYNITEANCTGFKIVVKDKRKKHQRKHGRIAQKAEIETTQPQQKSS